MRNVCLRIHGLALILVALMGVAREAAGQNIQTLIQFTNTWQYDQSGRNLAGTKWNTNDYVVDAPWQPASRGLLGSEPDTPAVYTVYAPITTPLTISSTVTTFYFRTTFQFSGTTAGMSLISTNLIDDGCVIYLNGREAGRLRVAANQNATTLATGGTEGTLEPVTISPTLLRQGQNLMAVEVHQSGNTSSDVMFGMKLLAIVPTTLVITNQPDNETVPVGSSVTFSVGVSGGPAFYQWQKDGANIANQTGPTYTIPSVQLANAGSYRVLVTNAVSSLISGNAILTVENDLTGPTLVSAIVRDTGSTNRIIVQFNEQVQFGLLTNSTSTNIANYRINVCGSVGSVSNVVITNASQGGSAVQLTVGGPNWVIGGCYYLTVSNVQDSRGNAILTNSQIGISFPIRTNVVVAANPWVFHANSFFESMFGSGDIYTNQWMAPNYPIQKDGYWGGAFGPCWKDPTLGGACLGEFTGDGSIGFQETPSLFRTSFMWPSNAPSSATIVFEYQFDDGGIIYLNGKEILRHNMPAGTAPVTLNTKAAANVGAAECFSRSIVVTNLVPGTNCVAAAVCQSTTAEGDVIFGLAMEATLLRTGTTPPAPERLYLFHSRLTNTSPNRVKLWWTNAGAITLETATPLVGSGPGTVWSSAPSQSNPQTNTVTGHRFYRLKR